MPTYKFKLIVITAEADPKDIDKARYGLYSYDDTDALLKGCTGIDALVCEKDATFLREAVFTVVADLHRAAPELPVIRVIPAPDRYSEADRQTALRFANGHTPASMVSHGLCREGGAGNLPPLTDAKLKKWITNYWHRTKSWPTSDSGVIPGSDGVTWGDIDRALAVGECGLPPGCSLAKFIAHPWGENHGTSPDPSSFVRCNGMTFRLGSVLAMACEEALHGEGGSRYVEMKTCLKLLISGEWVTFWGEQAERLHDFLAQTWIAGCQLIDLDASPPEPPTAIAEPQPSPPESAPETTPPPAPEPESEKRRFFL